MGHGDLQLKQRNYLILLVPKVGLEPTRYRYRRILSPLRLPFRHSGADAKYSRAGTPADRPGPTAPQLT